MAAFTLARGFLLPFILLLLILGLQPTPSQAETKEPFLDQPPPPLTFKEKDLSEKGPEYYLNLLALSSPPDSYALQLKAADLYLEQNREESASALLDQLPTQLSPELDAYRLILWAEMALHHHQNKKTLELLSNTTAPQRASMMVQKRFYATRALALSRMNRPLDSARARTLLDPLLDDAQQTDNRQAIWHLLISLPLHTLKMTPIPPAPDVFGGWLALAYLCKQYVSTPEQFNQAIVSWQKTYPTHPALFLLPIKPTDLLRTNSTLIPPRIALLLPQKGPYQAASSAITAGLMTAFYGQPASTIRTYDISEEGTVPKQYAQAIAEGATFVIGPLTKKEVQSLVAKNRHKLPVPTLALNLPEDTDQRPEGLYTLALTPEPEARQLAQKMMTQGAQRIAILSADSNNATRAQIAFTTQVNDFGGTLVSTQVITEKTNPKAMIQSFLGIQNSEQRTNQLRKQLGRSFEYQPYRRQDIDALALFASPAQGRQLRPLLNFYYAADLPLYATSSIYTGFPDAGQDQDLNHIIFCDMPWLIQTQVMGYPAYEAVKEQWETDLRDHAHLFALGMDAYTLAHQLPRLLTFPTLGFPAATGILYLNHHGVIERQLPWTQFSKGVPNTLNGPL